MLQLSAKVYSMWTLLGTMGKWRTCSQPAWCHKTTVSLRPSGHNGTKRPTHAQELVPETCSSARDRNCAVSGLIGRLCLKVFGTRKLHQIELHSVQCKFQVQVFWACVTAIMKVVTVLGTSRIRIVDNTTLRKLCRDKNMVSCHCRLKYMANVTFSSAFFMNGNTGIYTTYQSSSSFNSQKHTHSMYWQLAGLELYCGNAH